MIFLIYTFAELRRRRGRTLLTAVGLGVGVGLVIAVSALSAGLDKAQASILEPLTGVGTDMSVTRPIALSGDPRSAFQSLSEAEREQLRSELGGGRIDFDELTPGSTFNRTVFRSSQFSFGSEQLAKIASLDNVEAAAGGLTLSVTTITGTAPEQTAQGQGGAAGDEHPEGPRGGGFFRGNADFAATTISGVDESAKELGAITPGQLTAGSYFSAGSARQTILNVEYAQTKNKGVGDTITIAKQKYTIVGLAKTPLGGQASDVYVKLAQLQAISGRKGRVNTVYVRATEAGAVSDVAAAIESIFDGASVTTAETLASRVTGSLTSAKDLTQTLGLAMEVLGLIGAILIASLLSLASVSKRTRELGTLKAIGWSTRLVVRQIAGESLFQGVLGGLLGVALGLSAALAITAYGPELKASIEAATQSTFPGPFGQGDVEAEAVTQTVELGAQLSGGVVALAVALAVAGGLIAGMAGALRASRLRPVEALRHID